MPFRRLLPLALMLATTVALSAEDPVVDLLLPVAPPARQVLDQRCVLCHGELIDGEPEIREDLDLSTDEKIRETLVDVKTLIEMIVDDEMPHEAKLSFRLRRRPEMQERLKSIKDDYTANNEKEILLQWLKPAQTALESE